MKTLPITLLLLAVCAALAISIGLRGTANSPAWYYNSPCQKPDDESLEQWLPFAIPTEAYEHNVFDCSEMSALAEWLAENCGYDAQIAVVLPQNGINGHAWVIVEGRVFDAQTGVWDAGPWLPTPDVVYADIAAAQDSGFPHEWAWWEAKPELRSK